MLNKSVVEDVIIAALSIGGDFAEVFVEDKINTRLTLLSGKVEKSVSGRDYGVGIRIFSGNNSAYAYTNDSSKENLIKVAKEAAITLKNTNYSTTLNLMKSDIKNNNNILIFPSSVEKSKKVQLMKRAYNAAKSYDEVISQVTVNYLDHEQNVLIANSEGLFVEDKRVRTRLVIESIASKNNEMQTGFSGSGAYMGFELYDTIDIEDYAKESSRQAKTMINAEFCPSGKMPVIITNGYGGTIFHEACGHGLEATFIAKGSSVFCDKLGKKIASDIVNAVDDGTIPNAWGSLNVDDEGTKTKRNILIENGILKGYLIDKLNGRRMNMKSTGSARRESYRFSPTSRMNNTFITNGDSTFEEIISNTEYGLFAKGIGGGSVDPSTGDFNFGVTEGYIVKNGKIDRPVRGAMLIGNGSDILKEIDMVGNDLKHDQGICGSMSGAVPTNIGQPTIRVKSMTVGGRKEDK